MNDNSILERLQPIFDAVFMSTVDVTRDLQASDVEEWDSLTHISLILAIEDAFKIRFRVGEVEATRNVGELAEIISRKIGAS